MPKIDDVDRYVRHARFYGTECVFETALAERWPVTRLAALSLGLQNLDPSWRLGAVEVGVPSMPAEAEGIYAEFRVLERRHDPERNRRRRELWRKLDRLRGTAVHFDPVAFAHDLIDAGMHPQRACQAAMISRKTLRRRELHRNGGQPPEWGENRLFPRGAEWTNEVSPTQPLPAPNLSISAPQNGAGAVWCEGQLELFEGVGA